jgi:hypothetical protein
MVVRKRHKQSFCEHKATCSIWKEGCFNVIHMITFVAMGATKQGSGRYMATPAAPDADSVPHQTAKAVESNRTGERAQ